MVYFKDVSPFPGSQQLIILDDETQASEKGTCLVVRTPVAGRYARPWPQLINSLYMKEWSQEISLNKASKAWILLAAHHQHPNELICHQRSNSSEQSRRQQLNENFLPTLGRRIIQEKAKWGDALQFAGEFQYIKGYWEWTEDILSRCRHKLDAAQIYDSVYASLFTYDRSSEVMKAFFEAWCPLTNTLLTSFGELSISLWDLRSLAGLPLTGSLYDEVIPSFKELTGIDQMNNRFLPRSCKYLFQAYHLLRKSGVGGQLSKISIEKWISFWSRRDMKYCQPPPRKEKKRARPKLTHNPFGDFDAHREWTEADNTPFSRLGLDERLREETYLAAYLACWLCAIFLPIDEIGSIRPATFKMASIMAVGRKVGLAIPVLASIYKGLNKVSNSPRPTRVNYPFPVHFVSSWLACYFKTHYSVPQDVHGPKMIQFSGEGGARYFDPKEARKRIHKGDSVHWTCNMITKNQNMPYVDDGKAREPEQDYFIAIRSCYLPLRQGEHFTIEPYSPHRFSRQFGYYQEVPGVLRRDFRRVDLDDGLRYWRLCTLSKSMSKALFPSMPANAKKFSSEGYKEWWAATHGSYFDENIEGLVTMKPKAQVEGSHQDKEVNLPNNNDGIQIIEVTAFSDTNKRKTFSRPLEKSSSADRHWKRPKKDSDVSESKDINASNPSPTKAFAKELEKEILDLGDDDSQDSRESTTGSNSFTPIAKKRSKEELVLPVVKESRPCADISVFEGEKLVLNHQRRFLQTLWSDVCRKISNTSIDSVSAIQEEVNIVLKSMRSFTNFNISHLEGILKILFDKAAAYDHARSSSVDKVPKELLARQMKEARDRLNEARVRESKAEKELNDLEERKKNLLASLKQQQLILQNVQAEIREIEDSITTIGNTSSLNDEVDEEMQAARSQVTIAKEELENLKPFD